jgi:hypothetical protein
VKREHRISLSLESNRVGVARRELQGIFGVFENGAQTAETSPRSIGNTAVETAERMQYRPTGETAKSTKLSSEATFQPVVPESAEVEAYSDTVAIRKGVAYGAGVMGMRSAQLDPLESTPSGAYAEIDPTSEFTRAA